MVESVFYGRRNEPGAESLTKPQRLGSRRRTLHVEPGYEDGDVGIPEMPTDGPTGPVTRRNLVFGALFITAALVGLYFLVPKLTGLNQTWGRLENGRSTVAGGRGGFRAGVDTRIRGAVPHRVRARRARG